MCVIFFISHEKLLKNIYYCNYFKNLVKSVQREPTPMEANLSEKAPFGHLISVACRKQLFSHSFPVI